MRGAPLIWVRYPGTRSATCSGMLRPCAKGTPWAAPCRPFSDISTSTSHPVVALFVKFVHFVAVSIPSPLVKFVQFVAVSRPHPAAPLTKSLPTQTTLDGPGHTLSSPILPPPPDFPPLEMR